MIEPDGKIHQSGSPSLPAGRFEVADHATEEVHFSRGSSLYVFGGGICEVKSPDARQVLAEAVIARVGEQQRAHAFDGDVPLMRIEY